MHSTKHRNPTSCSDAVVSWEKAQIQTLLCLSCWFTALIFWLFWFSVDPHSSEELPCSWSRLCFSPNGQPGIRGLKRGLLYKPLLTTELPSAALLRASVWLFCHMSTWHLWRTSGKNLKGYVNTGLSVTSLAQHGPPLMQTHMISLTDRPRAAPAVSCDLSVTLLPRNSTRFSAAGPCSQLKLQPSSAEKQLIHWRKINHRHIW